MVLPSGEAITPFGPDIPSVPGTTDQPLPGYHASSPPTGCPPLSLAIRLASVGSHRLVTTIPCPGMAATASGQNPFGATTHPVQVNRGAPRDRSTANTSTDSRPP